MARQRAIQGVEGLHRDPVTAQHLGALQKAWSEVNYGNTMLWAAACLCFFGCLRAGEALAPEKEDFDPEAHLGWEDVQLEDSRSPEWISVKIKESKMDRTGLSGHSFRIGAATVEAMNGASGEDIKVLGRWKSREYKVYIRTGHRPQATSAQFLNEEAHENGVEDET